MSRPFVVRIETIRLLVGQGFDAGQLLAFEELEAGAAAGGDVGDLVGYAGLVDGGDRVAAADDGGGGLVRRNRLGDGVGADGEARELEDAGRAVPHDGAGAWRRLLRWPRRTWGRCRGPASRRGSPSRYPTAGSWRRWRSCRRGCCRRAAAGSTPLAFAFSSVGLGQVDLVFFDERLAGGDAEGALEGVGHAADDDERVDLVEQVVDDVDLAGDLRAADDGDEGLLGRFERLAEIGDFLFHQQAGDGGLEEVRDAFGGGMGAMRGAEGVVDVDLGQRGECFGEGRIVGFFFGVEAQVFEQQHLAATRAGAPFPRRFRRRSRARRPR